MSLAKTVLAYLVCFAFIVLSGCSIGPYSLKLSSAQYNDILVKRSNRELLLNIIRYYYGEPLLFLRVDRISAGYTYKATTKFDPLKVVPGAPTEFTFGLEGAYEETPTIDYSPLSGEKFIKQILSPIGMRTLYYLLDNCYIDIVMMAVAPGLGGPLGQSQDEGVGDSGERRNSARSTLFKAWRQMQDEQRLDIIPVPGEMIKIADGIAVESELKNNAQVGAVKEDYAYCPSGKDKYELRKMGSVAILIRARFPKDESKNVKKSVFRDRNGYRQWLKDNFGIEEPNDHKSRLCALWQKVVRQLSRRRADDDTSYTVKLVCEEEYHLSRLNKERVPSEVPELPLHLNSFLDCLAWGAEGIEKLPDDAGKVIKTQYRMPPEIEEDINRILYRQPKSGDDKDYARETGYENIAGIFDDDITNIIGKELEGFITDRETRRTRIEGIRKDFKKLAMDLSEFNRLRRLRREDNNGIYEEIKNDREKIKEALKAIKKDQKKIDEGLIKGGYSILNPMQIKQTAKRPKDALVAVPYRGHYFYIEDTDIDSKDTFMLLSLLFELQAAEEKGIPPIWAINVH